MQLIITYVTDKYYLSKIISEISFFNFGYLTSGHYIFVSKNVRIRGYFSKPKVVSERKCLRNTCLTYFIVSFSRNWNVTSTDCPVIC